jgi:Skp family chaperone for outer membrane proteins
MEIENSLNQMQSQQQTELMQMESVIQGDIAVKLSEEVASFANESGLDLVLNWGRSGEGVLYGNSGFDVTASLTEYMNERYVPEADSLKIERTK